MRNYYGLEKWYEVGCDSGLTLFRAKFMRHSHYARGAPLNAGEKIQSTYI